MVVKVIERVGPPLRQARVETAAHRRRRAAAAESEMEGGGIDKEKVYGVEGCRAQRLVWPAARQPAGPPPPDMRSIFPAKLAGRPPAHIFELAAKAPLQLLLLCI